MNTIGVKNTRDKINIWKEVDEGQRNTYLLDAMTKSSIALGQIKYDDPKREELFKFTYVEVRDIINENYGWWSLEEIGNFFELWVRGELGDNVMLSVRAIAMAFSSYIYEYRPKISRFIKETTPTLPESTKVPEIDGKAYLNEMYELYHDTGITYSKTYDILHKAGLIKNTKAEVERYLALAKLEVQQDSEKRVANGSITVWEYAQAIQEGPSKDEKIDAACKRIAVAQMFDMMKMREKPAEVIKAKRGTLKGYTGTIKLKTD